MTYAYASMQYCTLLLFSPSWVLSQLPEIRVLGFFVELLRNIKPKPEPRR